jgi:rhodanese-related sulfurtransferase
MLAFLKNLFKGTDYKVHLTQGAKIIDVRTATEYKNGHIEGSENIPLPKISAQSKKLLALNKTIILCCASGMRSGQATAMLKSVGVDALNGGSWRSLKAKI